MSEMQNNIDYVQNLEALGFMEGRPGAQEMNANVAELVHALHHVLAGGVVKVNIEKAGNAGIVEELGNKQKKAVKERNFFQKLGSRLMSAVPVVP